MEAACVEGGENKKFRILIFNFVLKINLTQNREFQFS